LGIEKVGSVTLLLRQELEYKDRHAVTL
jgi:hypothetical protein